MDKKIDNKILLVEDDAVFMKTLQESLQFGGFDVITARDGKEGLQRFNKEGAVFIVSDVLMPRMNGFEMADEIRKKNKEVPILFLSAKFDTDYLSEGYNLGCVEYLKKPFDFVELMTRIKVHLDRYHLKNSIRISIGRSILQVGTRVLERQETESAKLTATECMVLKELAEQIGQIVDVSTLTNMVWKRDDQYTHHSLHTLIFNLRRLLEYDPTVRIKCVRKMGYTLMVAPDAKSLCEMMGGCE